MTRLPRRRWLRAVRRMLASVIAVVVSAFPALEPAAVRAGRSLSKRSHLFAGLYWSMQDSLIARLRRQGERFRVVEIFDRRLQLDITDDTGRVPYFYRTPYKPGVTDAILTALRPGDVFIDIGAGTGYFTVLAARSVGARGRVIAFEADAKAREVLESVVERNEAATQVDVAADAAAALALDAWLEARRDLASRVRCLRIATGDEPLLLAGMPALLKKRQLTILCATTVGGIADDALLRAGFQRRRVEPGGSSSADFLYVRP